MIARNNQKLVCIAFALLVIIAPLMVRSALAQNAMTAEEIVPNLQPRSRLQVPRAPIAPRINGQWDDVAWESAACTLQLERSLQIGANDAAVALTQVRLLWSPEFLFVRFIATDDEIYTPFGRARDARHFKGDVSEIFLDPVGDGRQWIELQVSPNNGIFDQLSIYSGAGAPQTRADLVYTPPTMREVWQLPQWNMEGLRTATGRWRADKTRGWFTDTAIPAAPLLKRLGLKQFEPMTMRANFLRYEWAKQSDGKRVLDSFNWAPVFRGDPHRSPMAMGFIELRNP